MNQQQALGVLVQAVNMAQSRGAYSLDEASAIATAVSLFKPPESSNEEVESASEEE